MTKIFLTGITGLVGSAFTVALLRERNDVRIVCLVRNGGNRSAEARVEKIIQDQFAFDGCPEAAAAILSKIEVIPGDVVDLEVEKLAADPKMKGVNVVFHCAADVNLGKDPTGKTFRINYDGTKNIVALAKLLKAEAIHYVSTAYVAGKLSGRAMEDTPLDSGFNNPYEESKFKAEMLVRSCGIPFTIYRPAIITGRLRDGRIRKPLAFYRILEFMAKIKKHRCAKCGMDPLGMMDMDLHFNTIPSDHVYFVPIDYVQRAVTALFQQPVANRTYHVTGNSPVSTHMIDVAVCEFLRIEGVTIEQLEEKPNMDEKLMSRFLGDLMPYFSSDIIFDQSNIVKALGPEAIDWEFGIRGLKALIKSFFEDFFPHVDWLQELARNYEVR